MGNGIIGTGDKITVSSEGGTEILEIIISGDTDGDGAMTAMDYVNIKNHIMEQHKLNGVYQSAADVDNDNIHSLNSFFGIKYNGKKTTNQEGDIKEYLTCDSFTKDIFNERYKLTFRDYLQYLKSYRND